MKIAILGTRGIPNYHGGFEQFAEFFSVYLVKEGHEVVVYNSSDHPFKKKTFKGVEIIHKKDPEKRIGTIGQFIYDFNCIIDSRKRKFDIILQLGYTSSSIWHRLLPKSAAIITNMDGLEWKRSKYSKLVQKFLLHAEKLAVKSSDFLIADSFGIKEYLKAKYNKKSKFIAYGADIFKNPKEKKIDKYKIKAYYYNMLIARLEPENNIEIILDGVDKSKSDLPFLVIGKHNENEFGRYLKKKYRNSKNIRFIGGIYDIEELNNLRFFSNLYFHGHSVGGTNPSLLEAMASNALIIASDNIFNKSILKENAYYFSTSDDISKWINNLLKNNNIKLLKNNKIKIEEEYSWEFIGNEYLSFMIEAKDNK
ncbi:DUF1972 domain-containing protein [Flavivirga aquimarina]|uniref:DUF1972 domain-containing protein n=1 Tax=Flavivirga aquimarina TaxID=2027862 RepID=A0ABT8W8L4_9FLAO|nr:DUF1972 domain-containing protein [Flavivirga aquimarina]MDO5969482.1 DUF1972 domain-containing protein [Flavivirga aquimarina]